MDANDPSSLVTVNLEPFGKDMIVKSGFAKARKAREKEEKQFLTYKNLVQEQPRTWKYGWHAYNVYKMNYFLFPRTQQLCRGEKVPGLLIEHPSFFF